MIYNFVETGLKVGNKIFLFHNYVIENGQKGTAFIEFSPFNVSRFARFYSINATINFNDRGNTYEIILKHNWNALSK